MCPAKPTWVTGARLGPGRMAIPLWTHGDPHGRARIPGCPALRDVSLIDCYQPPDLLAMDDFGNAVDWQALEEDAAEKRKRGLVV